MHRLWQGSNREGVLLQGLLESSMPAIVLSRLQIQISLLKAHYEQPAEFVKRLRELFAGYADPIQAVNPQANRTLLVPAYNTPALLSREIEQSFLDHPMQLPEDTLEIIDLLWRQPELELRRLAIYLLGKLPAEHETAIVDRILTWSTVQEYAALHPYLFQQGSLALRRKDPDAWMNMLENWKTSGDSWKNRLSLRGLTPLIKDGEYANLPGIFTLLTSYFKDFQPDLQHDLLDILLDLANRSEIETTYFLKQMIAAYPQPALGRFLRQSLDQFPERSQDSLRAAMRNQQGLQTVIGN